MTSSVINLKIVIKYSYEAFKVVFLEERLQMKKVAKFINSISKDTFLLRNVDNAF